MFMQRWSFRLEFLALLVAGLAGSGCAAGAQPSSAVARESTQPVCVGPVARIGGKPVTKWPKPMTAVTLEAVNSFSQSQSGGGAGGGATYTQTHIQVESSEKFDVGITRALDGCADCLIHVKSVPAGAHAGMSAETIWTGMEIEIFTSKRAGAPKAASETRKE